MVWLRGVDLNHRPLGYEPNELPDCSTPHSHRSLRLPAGQCLRDSGERRRGRGLRLICDVRLFRAKIIKYEATLRDDLSLDPGCGIEPHVCCGQRREREGSF